MSAGDLLWVGFSGTEAPQGLLDRIALRQVSGVILFARNLTSPAQVAELTNRLRAAAPIDAPLLVAIDHEGGRVQRLRAPVTEWPPMAKLGALDDTEVTAAVGRAMGMELGALGIACNFAPCIDVSTNESNPVIGDRSFGKDPFRVVRHGVALLQGLQEEGIVACAKHYPGHGDTSVDSHLALPRVELPLDRLRQAHVQPFADMILADVPLVMTAHVLYPAVDPRWPATLSPVWLRLLREQLGFSGLIVSDDLEMKAIADSFGGTEAAVQAILAGCDVLLLCKDEALQHETFAAIERAERDNAELRLRIQQSSARIQALKALLPRFAPVDSTRAAARFPFAEHQALAKTFA